MTATNQDVDTMIIDVVAPHPVAATKVGPFDVVFIRFIINFPVELMDFSVQ